VGSSSGPFTQLHGAFRRAKARVWVQLGRKPGAYGYNAAKWLAIETGVRRTQDGKYGWNDAGIDERVVEYPWLFERVAALAAGASGGAPRALDAGSVLNHWRILDRWRAAGLPPVSIVTLAYEGFAQPSNDVRYEFADLRQLPYLDEWFTIVLCLSTIEHVGLDNRIYGSTVSATSNPTAESRDAMAELHRVTARGGSLLLSVPFGARSNRGWFRVLDEDDLEQLISVHGWERKQARFFRATKAGWRETKAAEVRAAGYNEPVHRPGQQTAPAWVAGAEAVALVELVRR
jgi:SAM-dependent methyltransferase